MKWAIDIHCQPSPDQLPLAQHVVETAVEFVSEALADLEVPEPAVEARMVP